MSDSNDLRSLIEKVFVFVDDQIAVFVHWDNANRCTFFLGKLLPGNDVRMLFHLADDDLVTFANEFSPIRKCDKIDALGRPADKDTFLRLARIYEAFYFFTRGFVCRCRMLR